MSRAFYMVSYLDMFVGDAFGVKTHVRMETRPAHLEINIELQLIRSLITS